jgi:hypothetical protein
MTEGKPNRRWHHFRLRMLLIPVLLALVLALCWLTREFHEARKHRETVNAVLEVNGLWDTNTAFFGVNLGKPVYVFGRSNWGDAELEKLKELTTLTQLDVDGCRGVTDAGMEHLQGMNNLKWLNISHTQVTEAGLKHLTSVTNLETLLICCLYQADGRKKISEEAIRELQEALPNCEIVGP